MKNKRFRIKTAVNLALIVLFSVGLIALLNHMQDANSRYKQKQQSILVLDELAETIRSNEENAEELTAIYHNCNYETLQDLAQLLESGLFDDYITEDGAARAGMFRTIMERADVDHLFVVNGVGRIVLSYDESYIGTNLGDGEEISAETLKELMREEANRAPIAVELEEGSYYFYSYPLQSAYGRYHMILGIRREILDLQFASLTDLGEIIGDTSVSGSGFVFAADKEKGTLLYYNDGSEVHTGESIGDLGMTADILQDSYDGIQMIEGKEYYCVSRACGDVTIITAAIITETIYSGNNRAVFWAGTLFLMTAFVSLAYAVFVRIDAARQGVQFEYRRVAPLRSGDWVVWNRGVAKKTFPVSAIGLVLIFFVSLYVQTLLSLSGAVSSAKNAVSEAETKINASTEMEEMISGYYEERYLAKAELIAYILEEDPSLLNSGINRTYSAYDESGLRSYVTDSEGNLLRSASESEALKELCEGNGIRGIYIFDEQGRTIATNTENWSFTISRTEGDQSYDFLQVLDGRKAYLIQDDTVDETGEESQYIGVPMKYYTYTDEEGNTAYASREEYERDGEGRWSGNPITQHDSLVQINVASDIMERIRSTTQVSYVLDGVTVMNSGCLLAFDGGEEHTVLYAPNAANIGKAAAELGFTENAFADNYNGFQQSGGVKLFISSRYLNGYYVAACIPLSEIYETRLAVSAVTVGFSFVCILAMLLVVILSTVEEEAMYEELFEEEQEKKAKKEPRMITIETVGGEKLLTNAVASRWDRNNEKWREMSPEKKLSTLIGACGVVLLIYVLASLFGADRFFGEESIISYIISGQWDRSVNIFALSGCAMLLVTVGVGVFLLNLVIRLVISVFGTKSETIANLLLSVLKYGGTMVSIFYCLYLIGFDSTSLLTSAGILSLVIGLGAQSLISDILAGVFIVFEGEYRVGDIVTIDGFRGQVVEIGLRTTKVMDTTKNVKIYNNSKISDVLNMTQEYSFAFCTVGIDYGESIERVEEVLKANFSRMRKNIPMILGDPEFFGVTELGDSSVVIKIRARCEEKNRPAVERALNREIFIIFGENGINIPFPQVTVSARDDKSK